MNPFQIPEPLPSNGWLSGFQLLKSPITDTCSAFGAQTAKWVPETDRLCYAIENQTGRQTSTPVMLRVRKPGSKMVTASK